jgi:geranylgeranyl pyrophosphate synthase
MRGVDVEQYARTHLHPIREIVDRGGKGWRSYAAITCIDIVGGDSRKFVEWIALPELMHVGSLIVDDVEDKSTTRRGGPTAHVMYGEGQAINSGTAAYFIGTHLLDSKLVSDRDKIRTYDLYFEALRAGHAGQAIDIDGFEHMMEGVVASGDSALLEERVLAVHRLKTAAPAGCLARMGAIAGGGSEAQIEGLGRFFEDLGLAFQIIDDVLNLRGFKGNLKSKAEDINQGKITLPVAKAMSRLGPRERQWLWETLRTKPEDVCVVGKIVAQLEACGAIEACAVQARALVEEGWQKLEPTVEDSLSKLLLRAFGWYVLERHY